MSSVSLSDAEISKAVEDGFSAQTAFLEQLVRFPSTRGNEHTPNRVKITDQHRGEHNFRAERHNGRGQESGDK